MPQFSFGSGVLFGVPLTDAAGAAVANPTPVKFGILQEASVDFAYSVKELYGQYQFPVAVGRGTAKVGGSAKAAQINAQAYASLFFGGSPVGTVVPNVTVEASNAIPTTPFQVTIAPPGGGTFSRDLGVRYSVTGLLLTRVASAPAAGQYSIAGAVYTFAAADTGLAVLISYEYTEATTGQKIVLSNQQVGYAPTFLAELTAPFGGKKLILTLNSCISTKLALATKLEDFMIPQFDFSAFADAANNLGTLSMSEL